MKTLNRPEITDEKIELIKRLIKENPSMGRTKLSVMLCEMWDWRGSNGLVKDMSCRDMLLSLEKAGKIVLPKRQSSTHKAGAIRKIMHLTRRDAYIKWFKRSAPAEGGDCIIQG